MSLNNVIGDNISYSNEDEYFRDINEIESLIKGKLVLYKELEYNEYRKHTYKFVKLVEKYQEQPYILDNYLERVCYPLTNIVAEFMRDVSADLHDSIVNNDTERAKLSINKQSQAKIYRLSDCIYNLCKIRGLKIISLYFPSEVRYLEAVVDYITLKDTLDNHLLIVDDNDKNWHFVYVLYVWLTTLVLIPFSFQVLDSKYMHKEMDLFKRTLDIVIPKVMENKYCIINETSSYLFAKILCRTDFSDLWRLNYSLIFNNLITNEMNQNPNSLGILIWIKYLVKLGPVESIELFMERIVNYLEIPILSEHANGFPSVESSDKDHSESVKSTSCKLVCISNVVVRCMNNKKLSKYFKSSDETVLDWSLKLMVYYNKSNHSLLKHTSSKCIAKILTAISSDKNNGVYIKKVLDDILPLSDHKLDDKNEENTISKTKYSNLNPNYIEGKCLTIAELIRKRLNYVFDNYLDEIIQFLKYCLRYQEWSGFKNLGTQIRDSACYIIWSLAKSVPSGILTKYVNDIIISALPLTVFDTQINGRRSSCAALQELIGRQGGENVPFGISIVTIADFFTISSVKSSFIEVSPKIGSLDARNKDEVGICYDNNNFKFNSNYPFSETLVNYLVENMFNHPQIKYRILSLVAFGRLVRYSTEKCYEEVLLNEILNLDSEKEEQVGAPVFGSNPIHRHSSLLIVSILLLKGALFAEITDFWSRLVFKNKNFAQFSEFTLADYIRNIPIMIEKNRLYRGKGGELTRKGVLCLIVSICKSTEIIKFKKATFSRFLQTILESIKHLSFSVQMSGTSALNALLECRMTDVRQGDSPYYSEIETLVKDFVSTINNDSSNIHIMALRGIILNVGLLFPKIVHLIKNSELVSDIINCLINVFNKGTVKVKDETKLNSHKYIIFSNYDIECRRNSLFSIGMVLLNLKNNNNDKINISNELFNDIFTNVFISGCFDYSVDKRGDIGSWIRELSMEIITCLYTNDIFTGEDCFCSVLSSFIFNVFNYSDKLRVKAILLLHKIILKLNAKDESCKYKLNIYWIYYRIFYGIPYEILELFLVKQETNSSGDFGEYGINASFDGSNLVVKNKKVNSLLNQLIASCSRVLRNIIEDHKLMYSDDQIDDIKSFFLSETNEFNNNCFFFDLLDSIETVPHSLLPYIDFDNLFLSYLSNRNFQIFSSSSVKLFKDSFLKFILEDSIQEPIIYGIINWISHCTSSLAPYSVSNYSRDPRESIAYELNLFISNTSNLERTQNSVNSIYSNLKSLISLLNNNIGDGATSPFVKILVHAFKFIMLLLTWDVSPCDLSALKGILLEVEDSVSKTRDFQLVKIASCIAVQLAFNESINKDIELVNKSLVVLSTLISHEYPTIRSYTADYIYNNICHIQDSERIDKILEFIRENQWPDNICRSRLLAMKTEFTRISVLDSESKSIGVL
ncbi:hypothetical protein FG386_000923 [Cryptosporidium ryanae]|uniref:uncharacterized protein n=1 Tax=Cryptosporidium ryanae TaxID=515981 RepID=UPI00351A91AD|nr:hypothetical protein FG386_000923 [Cryptosporidium ryanae]